MRAIPIDSFFEDLEEQGSSGSGSSAYDWRRIVSEGRAARTTADGGRWRIGQLALLVERRYASGALHRFAEEIGESYGSVRRYRWVAKAYDANARTRFASLSFSHFQAVAGVPGRLGWLERADRGGWSVDRLTRESRAAEPSPQRAPTDALGELRRSIAGMRRSIDPATLLDDEALAEAGKEWLAEELDELGDSVGRLRERIHRATQAAEVARTSKVVSYRKTSRKTKRPRRSRRGDPAADGVRSRNTALKARAVGR